MFFEKAQLISIYYLAKFKDDIKTGVAILKQKSLINDEVEQKINEILNKLN